MNPYLDGTGLGVKVGLSLKQRPYPIAYRALGRCFSPSVLVFRAGSGLQQQLDDVLLHRLRFRGTRPSLTGILDGKMQGGRAVLVLEAGDCPVAEQRVDRTRAPLAYSPVQRGNAAFIQRIRICSGINQENNYISLSRRIPARPAIRGIVQRLSAAPICGNNGRTLFNKRFRNPQSVAGGSRMEGSIPRVEIVRDFSKEEIRGPLACCALSQALPHERR